MITTDSRYVDAAHETASTHTYDQYSQIEYDSVTHQPTTLTRDTTYLIVTKYASPPPKQYMVKDGDNLQLLAYKSQQDPTKWWSIANANPQIYHPFDLKMGDMIHLPE